MRGNLLPIAAIVLASGLVILLSLQNRDLQQRQMDLRKELAEPHAGMWAPSLPATILDGSTVTLGQPDKIMQVLYFFEPSCPYCVASVPAMNFLSAELAENYGSNVQMLGISKDDADQTRSHVEKHGLRFPIALASDARAISLFRAHAVPLILVVDARGLVRHSHLGTISTKDEVNAILTAVRNTENPDTVATKGRPL